MSIKIHQSSESSRREEQSGGNENSTGERIYDSKPSLSEKVRAELEALTARADSDIDFSDIPALTDAQLSEFVHGPWTPLQERTVKLWVDTEVYEWLQKSDPKDVKRINLILKREAQRTSGNAKKTSPNLAKAS